ncbi:malto-oligosyltrehalose trehalohydrolase [Nodosilinea nodulosa]|uniref:malto-oligosyltrehalose trehalohydrolase n=1 Tax=Nodosilinea nodulosa TaxID=416001 RepID=UPI00031895BE|nr:malto-oligosyltrehalose trehalohydrolase [Nodosilinea nodulosa]
MRIGAHYLEDRCCEFTVWAPKAKTVAVQILGSPERLLPLEAQADGYWQATAADVEPGTRYLYQLDGETLRPDPASQFQPQGVHQPSQVVDPNFDWSDQNWQNQPLVELILYELHVGTFTPEGTFEAIIPRLPDLKALGVNAIELMPIAQFAGDRSTEHEAYRNWGYDGVFPFAVQNSYGQPQQLKHLIDACHQQGIAVLLDVVYNHFGPEGNYFDDFGPYHTEKYRAIWGNALNFDDAHSPAVRNFFLENALYWLRDFHFDGLRIDAAQAIYDLGAIHFLEELATKVSALEQQIGRPLHLIAESDLNDPRLIRPVELGGYGLDAQWADDFHHALYALLTGADTAYYQDFGRCEHLAKAYQESFVYDWKYAPHRHRLHGRSAVDRSPAQFVVCIQNHDQIANQLPGNRLSKLVSFEALKLAAGAVLLSPSIPLLFMGEEYGEEAPFTYFVSHSDPELIEMVREGRKKEFEYFHTEEKPLDPEAFETFSISKLNWEQRQQGNHQVLWSFYQRLIQLRQTLPALLERKKRTIEAFSDEDKQLVGWHRWHGADRALCLMNFNANPITVQPPIADTSWQKVLDSAEPDWMGSGTLAPEQLPSGQDITLQPHSLVLYSVSP